jgi:formylglycine-generating enzyme required for sulfatase activity
VHFSHIIAAAWLALLSVLTASQAAEKRVALVVGNAAYRHADRLANPVNDARGVRDALAKLGFDVIYGEDLDLKGLRQRIGQFAARVDNADVAIVFFAGHGATFADTPYVVPVDAEFSNLAEVPYELVALETLIGELRQAKGVRIAILDACRDNAAEQDLKRQATRGGAVSRGLAPMKNPSGLIIAYATQYLSTAADDTAGGAARGGPPATGGAAGHSPFTAALLNNIATPGLDVTDMFRKVGREVDAATGGKQRPEISISMYEQYALASAAPKQAETAAPGGSVPAAGPQTAAVATPVKPPVPADDPCNGPVTASFPSRCAAPLTAAQERALKPRDVFRECDGCPEMVVVPPGSFTMGSPKGEKERDANEGPQHIVTFGKPFAAGRMHVTVDQFAAFVRDTRYEASQQCNAGKGTDVSWRNPGFVQEGSHPAVCLSLDDVSAYVDWLVKKTGRPYRLLSEAEWEYAARGRTAPGAYPRFWFGSDHKDFCRYANVADQEARDSIKRTDGWTFVPCNDGYAYTSPAGHYEPNAFGLYDMAGNAGQWTADCWHWDYTGAPADGSAWTVGCGGPFQVQRGASWHNGPELQRVAFRDRGFTVGNGVGFRVARTLTGP